ncbi:MAG: hypothetical protein LC792_23055, partial [Actinobacteria bacterium]|nr:hypothetical protein [Actinomycetota bacterium]
MTATCVALLSSDAAALAASTGDAAVKTKGAAELPAMSSTQPPTASQPSGDFSKPPLPGDEPRQAGGTSFEPAHSTVLDAETTPTKKVFANPDGSRTAEITNRPTRFRDVSGAWRDIDVTLTKAGDGSQLVAVAAPSAARLAARSDAAMAVVDTTAGPVTLRHSEAAPVAATVDKGTATFAGSLPGGRDIALAVTADGFKESVVLRGRAQAQPGYVEQFVLPPGVSARAVDAGVEFVDASGGVVGTYGGGGAYDASPDAAAHGVPVTVGLKPPPAGEDKAVATVEVSVASQWLADPARVFPVTVDPTFSQPVTSTSGAD